MVQPASISRLLPTLTGRPPTPPRDSDSGEPTLTFFTGLFPKDSSSKTPRDITPNSSTESPNHPSGTSRKKVAWDDDKPPPDLSSDFIVQPLPPSGERKPIKSILKPYNGTNVHSNLGTTTKLSPPHTYANLAIMLESVAQQLAGKDRSSKMDAYTTLSAVLKVSENVPEIRALKEKMGLLLQFIRRDLTAKTSTGALDTTLVVNALVLLSIFIHRPAIAETMNSDFCVFLVDHAIRTFEDPGMSKDVVKHLMLILAEQNFSPKTMNGERVGRLISGLHDIENYVKGKSIAVGRLNIYRTLLRQSRAHMLVNTDWIHDLFSDMLSSFKETRTCAIAFGFEAGLVLGTESKASRAFMDLFSGGLDEATKFGDYYAGRLKTMVQAKQDMASVPQIWSVPILFLRYRPNQFEQWAFMNSWLGIIQECFNCSDQQTKFEANLAWNRLVFAIQPDERTTTQMITMLYRPLREQLKRKTKSISMNKGRKGALSSLCNLLYYSLKPSSTAAQLDFYWDQYVTQIVGKALTPVNALESPELARQDLMDACLILKGLFDSTTPRAWEVTRAMDFSSGRETAMEMSELPALDSRWLRKNAARVFPVLSPLLEKFYWDLGDEAEIVTALWKAYITSIASPAVKEVKVSNETMSCVAYIFNFLYKIWHGGANFLQSLPSSKASESETFLSSFESIISTTIDGLGVLPFTEKLLSIGSHDTFIVIATPSHRPGKLRGEVKCPLHHLFVLLTNVSPDLQYDRKFSQMVRKILTPFFASRPSSRARMDLVKDLLQLLPAESTEPCRMIWSILADFATFATDTRDEINSGTSGSSDQPLGVNYRAALKILEFGIDLSPNVPLPGWKSLFEALVTSATIVAGDGGRAIAVIEPLGRVLQGKLTRNEWQSNFSGCSYFRTVLSKATYPKDRAALDAARRRLWGTAAITSKASTFDPYVQLYEYMRESLEKGYNLFTTGFMLEYSDMISATTTLLNQCPTALVNNVLAKLQNGIQFWILDESSRLAGGNPLSHSVTSLWAKICLLVPHLARISNQSKLLNDLEVLIYSGLESQHRAIVNSSIQLWNSTFGTSQERFEYPPRIKDALLRLRPIAELQLPFFPESLESESAVDQRQPPNFANTQEDSSNVFGSSSVYSVLMGQPTPYADMSLLPRLRKTTPQVVIEVAQSGPVKRSRESTPDPGNRKSRKRNLTPKLRHDDSQIQFEAIESSPIVDAVLDSQILTDRQKEVMERQKAEAAMFPDIRSSPRPKGKSIQKRLGSNSELPLHGSASKPGIPDAERQTTPTLVAQGEYDDYVNSSPTPTRALTEEINMLDLPSAPLEAIVQELPINYVEDETDIPSSPPEFAQEPEHSTSSLDPSAQIDPCAANNNRTLSKFESTPRQPLDSTISESPAVSNPSGAEVIPDVSTANGHLDRSGLLPKRVQFEEPAEKRPNTPVTVGEGSPTLQQTPKTPQFHDALTSPASSDRNTVNEEDFEDALSSPQLNLDNAKEKQASSPLSDFDESSLLRVMERYDEGSGRPRRSARFSANEQNQNDPVLPSSLKGLSQPDFSTKAESISAAAGMESLIQAHTDIAANNEPTEEGDKSSPLPSLIPETPGAKLPLNMQVMDGEEIDLNETIIVDGKPYFEEYAAPAPKRLGSRRRKFDALPDSAASYASSFVEHAAPVPAPARISPRKRKSDVSPDSVGIPVSNLEDKAVPAPVPTRISPRKKQSDAFPDSTGNPVSSFDDQAVPAPVSTRISPRKRKSDIFPDSSSSPVSKKSKHEEVATDQSEVPDSQDAKAETVEPKKTPAVKKRNRGKPKRGSRSSAQRQVIEEPDPVQSFSSVDLDSPMQNSQNMDIATDNFLSNAKEPVGEERVEIVQTGRLSPVIENERVAVGQTEEGHDGVNISNSEVIAETTIDESSFLEQLSSAPVKSDPDAVVLNMSEIIMTSSEPVAQPLSSRADAWVQTEVIVELPTAETVRDKLRSIIGDLGNVALNREEMYAIEDLFMDAKEQLYGAGRRGRAGS